MAHNSKRSQIRALWVAGAVLAAGASFQASAQTASQPFAKATEDGKHLVVTDEQAALGTVYHALTDKDRQIFFESDAPLEDIKGQSNRVIGFVVAGTDGSLLTGEWHLPVDSIRTGIELRDHHVASKDWLDAKAHPNIVFQLDHTEDVVLKKETEAYRTYSVTLVGEFTIHGVTRPITIENASLTYLNASERTRKIADGDLLAIRAKYSVHLSDYDISHPVLGKKVADEIKINTVLYMTDSAAD